MRCGCIVAPTDGDWGAVFATMHPSENENFPSTMPSPAARPGCSLAFPRRDIAGGNFWRHIFAVAVVGPFSGFFCAAAVAPPILLFCLFLFPFFLPYWSCLFAVGVPAPWLFSRTELHRQFSVPPFCFLCLFAITVLPLSLSFLLHSLPTPNLLSWQPVANFPPWPLDSNMKHVVAVKQSSVCAGHTSLPPSHKCVPNIRRFASLGLVRAVLIERNWCQVPAPAKRRSWMAEDAGQRQVRLDSSRHLSLCGRGIIWVCFVFFGAQDPLFNQPTSSRQQGRGHSPGPPLLLGRPNSNLKRPPILSPA